MCLLVFDELLCVLLGQACEHQAEHGEIDHGFTAARQVLVILAHAAIAADPGQGALDHPAAWQMTKAAWALEDGYHFWGNLHPRPDPHATRATGMTHHHDLPAHVLLDPGAPGPGVAIVDPDQADAWEAAVDRLQQEFHPLAILDIGRVHDHVEHEPHRVHE